jgi:hypothetical protein
MSKKIAAFLSATLGVAATGAFAELFAVADITFACKERETLGRLADLHASGDKDASEHFLLLSMTTGKCILLSKGLEAFAENISTWHGMTCVRPKGTTDCFWAMTKIVRGQ